MNAKQLSDDYDQRLARDLAITEAAAARRRAQHADHVSALDRRMDALPELTLVKASTIKPEGITWLWPYWLARGKLHVLAGAPGTGKTTIALRMIATVTSGGRWPDGSAVRRGNVLLWSGEDGAADTLVPRLIAAGADLDRVFIVGDVNDSQGKRPFDPAIDMDSLHVAAAQLADVLLLVVDPIVSAVGGDSHKNTEVRRALQPLVNLGDALGCAVLGISHFSKGTAGRSPIERVTGSIAFGAVARVVLATARLEAEEGAEPQHILVRAKSNLGPDTGGFHYSVEQIQLTSHGNIEASRVSFGAGIEGSARELLAVAESETDTEAKTQTAEAEDWLAEVLGQYEVKAKAVQAQARECGIADKALRRAREKLGVKPRRVGGTAAAGYWVWGMPGAVPHSDPVAAVESAGKLPNSGKDALDAHTLRVGNKGKLGPIGHVSDAGGPILPTDETQQTDGHDPTEGVL